MKFLLDYPNFNNFIKLKERTNIMKSYNYILCVLEGFSQPIGFILILNININIYIIIIQEGRYRLIL